MIIDCHNHIGSEFFSYLASGYPYAQDLDTLAGLANHHAIDYCIVFPFVSYAALDLKKIREGDVALAEDGLERVPYAFENQRLAIELYDFFPHYREKFLPFAIVDPYRRVEEQIAALKEQHARHPFWGIKIQSTVIRAPILSLLQEGKAFVDFAGENDLPFLIHSSKHPDDVWAQAWDILKVAETFPSIRFCLAHSCRFDRTALDRVAELDNCWFDCSAHRIHCVLAAEDSPVVAVKKDRFVADYRDPDAVLAALGEAYPDKLMWGSDSPFQSYAVKTKDSKIILFSTYAEEVQSLRAVAAPYFPRVAGLNTAKYLGRPLPGKK